MARYKMSARGGDPGTITRSLVRVLLLLWIGGLIVWEVGISMLGSCSPFYKGLSLIGWKVGNNATAGGATTQMTQLSVVSEETCWYGTSNILYDVSGTGILVIVGLVSIAYVAMQFIKFTKF